MSVLVASDLDRTLIYSEAASRLGLGPDDPTPDLVCVEEYEGAPMSFVTPRAARLLAELAERTTFVPTTTRTREQYGRIRLPGPLPEFAICANGGHLLVAGESDPDWHEGVRKTLAVHAAPLAEVVAHLKVVALPAWTHKLRVAEDLFTYLVVERAALPPGFVPELTAWAAERGYGTSLQGRKLYLVPDALTKGEAVREVARRCGAESVLAAGDSLLDIELLRAADAGIRPGHGELAESGWSAPHVEAITTEGVQAGERIAGWLVERSRLPVG
ncbi:HAD family hydrolase [Streptomyces sp. SID3343]|uniref:HAD family hydrolase n=1 Tax=Streptomyces sp. SID3343 TaxID=2690260 RepID=UPI00136E768A|nr:HAD family hydrolase [Streptomyces sp. SID3343]